MSGILHNVMRMALSLSLMDRELFVSKVAEFLEQYRNDPAQMEKVAAGLYQYLDEMKGRMDLQDTVSNAISSARLPSSEEVTELTRAIEKLAAEMHEQNQKKD